MKDYSWYEAKFGDVVELKQGLCFNKKTNHLMAESGIPLLRITDLINNTETKFVDAENVPQKFIAKSDDIIYTRTGQVGFVFTGRVGVVHNNCFRIIPNQSVLRKYIYWYLKQPEIIEHARTLASGAAQPDLNHSAFKSMYIRYPDLPTQVRIVSILSTYDDLIKNNIRRIQILEEMAQRIYAEWFVCFMFPGHEKVKMVDSELGQIPLGWKIAQLKETASVNEESIKTNNAPNSINYIDIKSVSASIIHQIKKMPFSEAPSRARRIVQSEDIIWSTVRPNLRAYALVLEPEANTIASTGFAVITPKKLPYTYLYCHLTTDSFVEYLVNHTSGAAYPAVNQTDFKNSKIIVPDELILRQFHEDTNPFWYQSHVLKLKNEILRKTRDLLLPKLISGEIDVSDMSIPEEIAA